MRKFPILLAALLGTLVSTHFLGAQTPTYVTPQILLQSQVTTPGVAVTAIAALSVVTGCWIQNDPNSTTNLIVDNISVANHVTPSSSASILPPGASWSCPGNGKFPVTVDSSDVNHKFFGEVY